MSPGRRNRLLLAAACLIAGLTPVAVRSDQSPALTVEDALKTHALGEISPLALSPDGKSLAYMVRDNERVLLQEMDPNERYVRTGVHERNLGGQVWISDIDSGETKNLTGPRNSSWGPVWSPDGRYLAFLSDREGTGQARLWVWDSIQRRLRLVIDRPVRASHRVNPIVWTPDSRAVLITMMPEGIPVSDYVRKILFPDSRGKSAEPSSSTVVVLQSPGPGLVGPHGPESALSNLDAQYLHDLELVEVETGIRNVLVSGERVVSYRPSPDGRRVAYATTKGFHRAASRQMVYDICTIDLRTMRKNRIASNVLLDYVVSWSPDSVLLAYSASREDETSFDYYVIGADGGMPRNVSTLTPRPRTGWATTPLWGPGGKDLIFLRDGALWRASSSDSRANEVARISGREIRNLIEQPAGQLWSPDGGRSTIVIAHDENGKEDGFYEIDLATAKSSRMLERGECYTCKWSISDSAYFAAVAEKPPVVAYVAEDVAHSPDIWVADTSFTKVRQLTHLNPQFGKYKTGKARLIKWLSDDGKPLRGALLLPSDYRAGKRVPLIVWAYSGVSYSDSFDRFGFCYFPGPLNMQLFATRGYAILFADAMQAAGQPAENLGKSVLPGVNKVIEMGIADPGRIGLFGHSGAAYAALALVARTKRFRAAIAADGWGDFAAFFGTMRRDGSAGKYFESEGYLGGDPWQYPLRYLENSPVFFLDQIDTPLLILHGANDENVFPSLSDEVFVGLRHLGKRVEYAKYEGETHVPADWSYTHQVDFCDRMIGWFEQYLKGNKD